jgi:O-methyltransferase involved in polyketide biosynthesis
MAIKEASSISPTAHYTAFVWYRNKMSHPTLATAKGRTFFYVAAPLNALSSLLNGGLTLERTLLQRHRIIDHLLGEAIESGRVGQVLEIACGLSPRGFKLAEKHGGKGLTVVEADLPAMAQRKKALLIKAGLVGKNHHIVTLNVLADTGPETLQAVADRLLDPSVGTAIITEGLVSYFDKTVGAEMWRRFAELLKSMAGGVYYSDLHIDAEMPDSMLTRLFRTGLELTTRGETHQHFEDAAEANAALEDAGFDEITLHRPAGFAVRLDIPTLRREDVIRVIEARV